VRSSFTPTTHDYDTSLHVYEYTQNKSDKSKSDKSISNGFNIRQVHPFKVQGIMIMGDSAIQPLHIYRSKCKELVRHISF
jgi:hypothetical protein